MVRITEKLIKGLKPPKSGNEVVWDDAIKGLGVRITASGAKGFVLRYVIHGRERRMALGAYPDLTVTAAREFATKLKGRVAHGHDPLEEKDRRRKAPTVRVLADDYMERHAKPHKRAEGVQTDQLALDKIIVPKLGAKKVADISRRDIEALHQSLKATPYRANRIRALLSKMFSLAVEWGWRADNPVLGVKKFPEERRERWLNPEELSRLTDALDAHANQRAVNAIRLLILTGSRRGEVLNARWQDIDFERRIWTKPSAHTKQNKTERVPLSPPALALLSGIHDAIPDSEQDSEQESEFVFPGDVEGKPLTDIKRAWQSIRKTAGLEGVRLHDLRHTYASYLVSSGQSLEIVGRLLGHTQAATTQRYAHIADDPLREATGRIGALYESVRAKKPAAEVVPIRKDRSA